MKNLTIKEFEVMLCSTGYLPPRNEEELLFFEQMYKGCVSRFADKHVDVDSIINGRCRMTTMTACQDVEKHDMPNIPENRYSMAARNFNNLPNDVLEKMKDQHKLKDEDDK